MSVMQQNFDLTPDEKRQIELNAHARGLGIGEYCRLAVLLLINDDDWPIKEPHPDAY